jgi:putative endonuclease
MWYVYILESGKDNKHYIGSTNDLNRRIEEHNNGFVESTSARRPLRLVSYIAVETEKQARSREVPENRFRFLFHKKKNLPVPVVTLPQESAMPSSNA